MSNGGSALMGVSGVEFGGGSITAGGASKRMRVKAIGQQVAGVARHGANKDGGLEDMVVSMLKNQVKKRKKFQRRANNSHLLAMKQLQNSEMLEGTASSGFEFSREKSVQTPPDEDVVESEDLIDPSQLIIFNMLSPGMPSRQIYVTTSMPLDKYRSTEKP